MLFDLLNNHLLSIYHTQGTMWTLGGVQRIDTVCIYLTSTEGLCKDKHNYLK